MPKDKYDFILELLEYKKLNSTQKERILRLAAQEIKNGNTKDEELLNRIEKIEQLLKREVSQIDDNTNAHPPPTDLLKYIDPKDLFTFLKDYNTDPILKTTCHEIDSNELLNILSFCQTEAYDFRKHRQIVQERFLEMVNDKKYFVDYKIKKLMYLYITGKTFNGYKDGWTDEKINISWNSENVENWCKNNLHKVPHPDSGLCSNQGGYEYEIRPSINTTILGHKKLRSFSDLILHFKHLFHLRSDNSLLKTIQRINDESEIWQNKIQFEIDNSHFPESIEFFTNVEKLIQAYKILIGLILDVVAKNNLDTPWVKLSLLELTDGMELLIHHKNSTYKKTIQNSLERDGQGQTFANLIRHQINGLCELYVKADFGNNQYAEINIWNGQPKVSTPIEYFEGVEYKLKFKK